MLFGFIFTLLSNVSSYYTGFLGLTVIIACSIGTVENWIKGYSKLQRYKSIYDSIELSQSEIRKMQAEDL